MNKIALISPARTLWAKNPKIAAMFENNKKYLKPWYAPPLGLLTIASLTPIEIEIDFIDEDFEEIDFSFPYALVAISAMTQQAYRAYFIADKFREKGISVVMGGIHATVLPMEALQHVDTVFIGEAEITWKEYLHDFENGTVKSIYKNPDGVDIDICKSPIPRYDLLKNKNYISKGPNFFNMITIQATRGCPHDCSFCVVSKIYGKKIRKKRIEQILKEIEQIQINFGNALIGFADDNFFADKKFIFDLLKEIQPLKIKWFAQSDVSLANDNDLIQQAYSAGCTTILIGFESLNPDNLTGINANNWKMKQISNYSQAVQRIQRNGIIVYAAFVIGFDNDTYEVFKTIKDFVVSNCCTAQFTILTPLPGTKIYNDLHRENRLFSPSFWDQCNFFDIVFKPKYISTQEIENGLIWLYNEVFNFEANEKRFRYMVNIYKSLSSR